MKEDKRGMEEEGTLMDYLVAVVPIGKRNAQTSNEIFWNHAQGRAALKVVQASLSTLRRKGLIQSEVIGPGRQRIYWKGGLFSKEGIIGQVRGMMELISMRKKEVK